MRIHYYFLVGLFVFNFSLKAELSSTDAQAMFVYNFLRYVSWPDDVVQQEYIIGIAGDSEIYNALIKYTKNREIAGKPIKIVICKNCDEMLNCQLLYIPKSKSSRLPEIVEKLKTSSCLTIFDNCEGISSSMALIDFIMVDNRLRYRVNAESASNHNLLLSTILYNLSI